MSAQAQKFVIFEKKLSLGVRSPCLRVKRRFGQFSHSRVEVLQIAQFLLKADTLVLPMWIFYLWVRQNIISMSPRVKHWLDQNYFLMQLCMATDFLHILFCTAKKCWNAHWIKSVQVLQNFLSLLFSRFFHCSTFLSILQYISNRKDIQKGDYNQKTFEIPRFHEKFWKKLKNFPARWLGNNFQVHFDASHISWGNAPKAYETQF